MTVAMRIHIFIYISLYPVCFGLAAAESVYAHGVSPLAVFLSLLGKFTSWDQPRHRVTASWPMEDRVSGIMQREKGSNAKDS